MIYGEKNRQLRSVLTREGPRINWMIKYDEILKVNHKYIYNEHTLCLKMLMIYWSFLQYDIFVVVIDRYIIVEF